MNSKLHPLVFAAAVLSLSCSLAGQSTAPRPALPPAGGAPANVLAPTREGSIPDEFKPLDDGTRPPADTVNKALEMVKKAVIDKTENDFKQALDRLIEVLKNSATFIEGTMEPECHKVMERAQISAREYAAKAGTSGITPAQKKLWTDIAQTFNTNAEAAIGVIKKMQDTRVELMTKLKAAESLKLLIQRVENTPPNDKPATSERN